MYEILIGGAIKKVIAELELPEVDFTLEHPKDLGHGDYATNIALIVGKKLGQNPIVLAGQFVKILKHKNISGINEIKIAGPGFINFTLDRSIFIEQLKDAKKLGDKWGHVNDLKGQKILVEHSSPNLFKPFHIGHLMNNTIGEAIVGLARASGAEVTTMSFPSDISLGTAKAIFVVLDKYGEDFEPTDVSILGESYVEGTKRYEEDESIHARVKEIADNLYAGINSSEFKIFKKCKDLNMEYFENITTRLGSHFDSYIYESEAGEIGKEIVKKFTSKVFTESEGAIVYIPEESRKDINTAVFINSQGNPTYEAKDVGLMSMKFERYNPDKSIFITDNHQIPHFQIVLDAVSYINKDWQERSIHRTHGRMSFKGQKMSSRLGGVPLAEDVLDTVVGDIKEKNSNLGILEVENIAISAIKFSVLRAMAGKDINFDPETSLSFEGDSGPYLQYVTVRAGSLLTKGLNENINPDLSNPTTGTETLEKIIVRFPEVVSRSINEWAPHHVLVYLVDLAQYFNTWYGQGKIIDENEEATTYRLAIVESVKQTINNGLKIIGISTPEKM